ncbi:MAG: hypothetical protein AAFX57_03965, partial [Bacteroidota bacterium]
QGRPKLALANLIVDLYGSSILKVLFDQFLINHSAGNITRVDSCGNGSHWMCTISYSVNTSVFRRERPKAIAADIPE